MAPGLHPPPLSGPQYSPGLNLDFWSLGLIFLSISIIAGAVNFIVTIFKMRAPGMSINRMPLFAWAILVASFTLIFAVPSLISADLLLELERKFGFHFFQSAAGGNPLLWQHLFWVFGQPEFSILLLPAFGIVSEVVSAFSRRPALGYTLTAASMVATGIIFFGSWLEHMFSTGISPLAANFSSVASGIIVIPFGVLIFTWLGTLLSGRPVWKIPLMWVGGFIFLFVVGVLTGILLAAPPFNLQMTNTYFSLAQFHSLLAGGAVFPIFAGFYYWVPKIFGRMLDVRLGKFHFWMFFTGALITFVPMFILGLEGMPQYIYTYRPGLGWDGLNLAATIGAFIIAESILIFFINIFISLSKGKIAGDNPWDASSLEWATASPPEPYNFRRIPIVRSRVPLWTSQSQVGLKRTEPADLSNPFQHETPVTTVLDAQPESIVRLAGDSLMPLWLAISQALIFVGLLISQYWLTGLSVVLTIVMIFIWLWRSPSERENA